MTNGLIVLLAQIQQETENLSLEEYSQLLISNSNGANIRYDFYPIVRGNAQLSAYFHELINSKKILLNKALPDIVRQESYVKLKSCLSEFISFLQSGAVNNPVKRISDETIIRIDNPKVKQLCFELNSTPPNHVISLGLLLGELLKWTLYYKAKECGSSVKEDTSFEPLLKEVIDKSYYETNISKRFLSIFANGFQKGSYDQIRHSNTHIPERKHLDDVVLGVETILKETF